MFTISNIYGHGFDRVQLSKIERLGFRIRPQISRFMGSQICRFIDFNKGPALELIEVENEKEYLDFVPKGMKPYCPGISLVLPETSERNLRDFEQEFSELQPYDLHVNYDGSTDPRKPGWNYLNFEIPLVTDTFIWLTKPDKPQPIQEHNTDHPNGVKGILGLVFDLENEDLKKLSELVKEDVVDGVPKVDGLEMWSKSTMYDFPNVRNKLFPLLAIVLKTETFDYFVEIDDAREVSFMSRPAMHIETNRLSWDLLVIT